MEIACVGVTLGDPFDAAPMTPIFLLFPEDGKHLVLEGVSISPFGLREGPRVCQGVKGFDFVYEGFPGSLRLAVVVSPPATEETTQGADCQDP